MTAAADTLFAIGLLWWVGAAFSMAKWGTGRKADTFMGRGDARRALVGAITFVCFGLVLCGLAAAVRFWPW